MDSTKHKYPRITSIDALRAFALFGILLVHINAGFGTNLDQCSFSTLSNSVHFLIDFVFKGRCALIFNILFGISFYIILRKPDYPSSKFVWRCFLLLLIGLFNKLFYSGDALMWYGLCGMLLVTIRNVKTNHLIWIVVGLYLMSFLIKSLRLGDMLDPYMSDIVRYRENITISEILAWYPTAIIGYVKAQLNGGFVSTFANFVLGYWMGRIGFVDKWDSKIKIRHILLSLVLYGIFFLVKHYMPIESLYYVLPFYNLAGSAFYTFLFIYIYNHSKGAKRVLHYTEAYGKCGLTNYSMQGIVGVLILCHFGQAFRGYEYLYLAMGGAMFFLLQIIFSNLWLRYFRNGPMEYIWRCATEREILPLLKK